MWNVARSGEQCLVPVLALRLTHKSVNKNMAFGDSHAPRQESVYKLLNDPIVGRTVLPSGWYKQFARRTRQPKTAHAAVHIYLYVYICTLACAHFKVVVWY